MIAIRNAKPEDNEALIELEKACPQGTNLVLQFDRSPDFFLRSQVYDDYKVYVVEEKGTIIGTAASAVNELTIGKKKASCIYIYDLRVHPNYRGRGIGSSLIQKATTEEGNRSQLAYAIVAGDNYPSIGLFQKMGFQSIREVALLNIPLYARKERIMHEIRTAEKNDLPQIVNLINDHYRNHDFFSPLSTDDMLDKIQSLPGYDLQKVQVAEVENHIVACAGLWDYSQIFRITAMRISAKLRILSYLLRFINIFKNTAKLPSLGDPFRIMYVRDFAYTGHTKPVEDLIEHCLSTAYRNGCNFLSFALDSADPAIPLLARYSPIRTTYRVYAKTLKREALGKPNLIYVDPADL